jgi:hypothetical protein
MIRYKVIKYNRYFVSILLLLIKAIRFPPATSRVYSSCPALICAQHDRKDKQSASIHIEYIFNICKLLILNKT